MAQVGSKLIFENERVRVWEFTLQPGETIDTHKHEHDYFFSRLKAARWKSRATVAWCAQPSKRAACTTAAAATPMRRKMSTTTVTTRCWSN